MKFSHRLRKDDDGWYECQYCGRVSKNPDLLTPLACKPREGVQVDATLPIQEWKFTKVKVTQAVSDEVSVTPSYLDAMLKDEIRRMAKKDHLYVVEHERVERAPMSTMPGYTVYAMSATAMPMQKIVLSGRVYEKRLTAYATTDASQHPVSRFFEEAIKHECYKRGATAVTTEYERVEIYDNYEEWEARVWIRPSHIPAPPPGASYLVTPRSPRR